MIKAPFNFVPLSDKVYLPEWANLISHDVPFEDGLSGVITLKITAETPLFVRNGHTKEDKDKNTERYCSFSKSPEGNFFIPATSIKGAFRNVMEIMSFGKMKVDKNAAFAQREWFNADLYTIKSPKVQSTIRCGWLREVANGYEVVDCGRPYRIAHVRIDELVSGAKPFEENFRQNSRTDLNDDVKIDGDKYDPKTAVYKYKLMEGVNLSGLKFSIDEEYAAEYKENRVRVDEYGEFSGTIVFTGQPDKWMFPRPQKMVKNAGKFYEFVFPTPHSDAQKYPITEQDYKNFEFIYTDSPDWKFAKRNIGKEGIPVFFRVENKKIKDWGLAFLYKLPYENTPYKTLYENHRSKKLDLCECVFGHTSGSSSLKGRVLFSNAFSNDAQQDSDIRLILGSPKASYYPLYIRQNETKGKVEKYLTYNDGQLSGWKRYVVRKSTFTKFMNNDNLDTIIHPVKAGATFHTKLIFHNLRPIELGALLTAITFHDTEGCYHQMGQGKPYGFGRVTVAIENYPSDLPSKEELMSEFENAISNKVPNWDRTQQIINLISMSSNLVSNEERFLYMNMDMDGRNNEFVNAKAAYECLQLFSNPNGKSSVLKSMLQDENELRTNAEQLEKDNYKEALKIYKKLKERFPNKNEYNEKIVELEKYIKDKEDADKAQNILIGIEEVNPKKPLPDRIEEQVSFGALFTAVKKYKNDFSYDEIPSDDLEIFKDKIKDIYDAMKPKEQKKLKFFGKKEKDLETLIGKELALQWFNEITGK